MAFQPEIALFDACILYPFHLRNIMIQAAVDRLVDARWTDQIHEEWIGSLAANNPNIPIERLQKTRHLMNHALPTATVHDYDAVISAVNLPDPGDRHVVAAAITASALVIITWNLRHFPEAELRRFGLTARTPDDFLARLHDRAPDLTMGMLANARRNLKKSRVSADDFMEILINQRLTKLAETIKNSLSDL